VSDFADGPETSGAPRALSESGYRLDRLEVFNWGTFHEQVWSFTPQGQNALLTGDIGSGKSTLVDAITTLLVPPQKLAYNRAAGAEARERSLRSYVFGYYKSERGESGTSARPVGLRDHNNYSVILARFHNRGFSRHVTLAQVFWSKDVDGPPARLFVVADRPLSIAEHFAGFGTEMSGLRKRLRHLSDIEVNDTFPPYAASFRRRLGIDNEQALELFHQTVSMKSVSNLTEFVRDHMLEAFPVEERIDALIRHFNDLNRAHEAVRRARAQVERLTPLVEDCRRYAEAAAEVEALRKCRELLRPWFAELKVDLLEKREQALGIEREHLAQSIRVLEERLQLERGRRDDIKNDIAQNGGERLASLKREILENEREKRERAQRAAQYDGLAAAIGLPAAGDAETFLNNRRGVAEAREATEAAHAQGQNALTESTVEFRMLREQHAEVIAELSSLKSRRSNVPTRMLALRERICAGIDLPEVELPFAGELLQVREDERDWEGAIERLLHRFGTSLLVADAHYPRVAEWVDKTHLAERLVYLRVRERGVRPVPGVSPDALVRKISIKPDTAFYPFLEVELAHRFDHVCCDTLDRFRREERAITRFGQIKSRGADHEKDDRHRIDDRTRFVLGWSNEAKISAVQQQADRLEERIQRAGARVAELQANLGEFGQRLQCLSQLEVFQNFRDLDWRPLVQEIERLENARRELESGSDVLRALEQQLTDVEGTIRDVEIGLNQARGDDRVLASKTEDARNLRVECTSLSSTVSDETKTMMFPRLEAMRVDALGEHTLTLESCDNREKDLRGWLQAKVDAEDHKQRRLSEKILLAMAAYRKEYPLETQEVDASLEAAQEYQSMLARIVSDDLPRFEERFKQLLNENTIREVANFQSQLGRERQTIRERIDVINTSLHEIDYNTGRYIRLEPIPTPDPDVRDFQQSLRSCTEGALTGSIDEEYSEAKFLQVRQIIERFTGREGSTELDRRWTRKVTDVRNWFTFAASERWREGDIEHEHYADSGGKSGGQKEKLAYTVLAASLAYQFGLEWGVERSRSFRFVVIDEAFGRGSDESARYGLALFQKMNLQLLIVTPLQKIHIIEPYVAAVGFVHNEDGRRSMLRNLTIEEYRAEKAARIA